MLNKKFLSFLDRLKRKISYKIIKYSFLLNSDNKQIHIINKNVTIFMEFQDLAKSFNKMGDLRSSNYWNGKSFDILGKLSIYCEVLNINLVDVIKNNKSTIRKFKIKKIL